MMRTRCPLPTKIVATAATAIAGAVLASLSLSACGGSNSSGNLEAATDAAKRYVQIIAAGHRTELAQLEQLEVDGDEQSQAVTQLAAAKERIEVTSVSAATATTKTAAPGAMGFSSFARTTVSYRLAGHDRTATLVLGVPRGGSASKASGWRVLTPMLGRLSWTTPALSGYSPEVYIGAVRQDVHGNVDQPLYPGVYSARATYGGLYDSTPVAATVIAGKTTPGPGFTFHATAKTKQIVDQAVAAAFRSCAGAAATSTCPVMNGDLARSLDLSGAWWGGLSLQPKIRIRENAVTLSGGQFVYRHGGRPERIDFTGAGGFTLTGDKEPTINRDDFYLEVRSVD